MGISLQPASAAPACPRFVAACAIRSARRRRPPPPRRRRRAGRSLGFSLAAAAQRGGLRTAAFWLLPLPLHALPPPCAGGMGGGGGTEPPQPLPPRRGAEMHVLLDRCGIARRSVGRSRFAATPRHRTHCLHRAWGKGGGRGGGGRKCMFSRTPRPGAQDLAKESCCCSPPPAFVFSLLPAAVLASRHPSPRLAAATPAPLAEPNFHSLFAARQSQRGRRSCNATRR